MGSLNDVVSLLAFFLSIGGGIILITGFYVTNRILSHYGVVSHDISRRTILVVGAYSLIGAGSMSMPVFLFYLYIYGSEVRLSQTWQDLLYYLGIAFFLLFILLSMWRRPLSTLRKRRKKRLLFIIMVLLAYGSAIAMIPTISAREDGWFFWVAIYQGLVLMFMIIFFANHLYKMTELIFPESPKKAYLVCDDKLQAAFHDIEVNLSKPVDVILSDKEYTIVRAVGKCSQTYAIKIANEHIKAMAFFGNRQND